MTVYSLTGVGKDLEVDPISRIEGHLGIKVRVNTSNVIVDANAHGNLWRGFENFLLGRAANDAITFVQRICGVCPVPHGLTSTFAVDTVFGYSQGHITFKQDADGFGVPPKALLIRNLVLSAEFLMSSITHFYHLAAPSYVQGPAIPPWTPYFDDSQYSPFLLATKAGINAVPAVAAIGDRAGNPLATPARTDKPAVVPDANPATMQLWDAVIISYVRALKIRRMTFEAGALFAGRMPMTSCFVAGGVTNNCTEDLTARVDKFIEIIRNVGDFVVKEYVPIALALGFLYPKWDNSLNTGAGSQAGLGYGAGVGRFLSWGAFPSLDDTLTLKGGIKDTTAAVTEFTVANKAEVASKFLAATGPGSVRANLTEDISNSRYAKADADLAAYTGTAAYPGDISRTKPNRANGYSYIKAPRWATKPCEVGPLARLVVSGLYPVAGATNTRYLAGVVPGYRAVYTTADAATAAGIIAAGGTIPTSVFRASAVAPTIVAGLTNLDGTGAVLGAVLGYVLNLKGGLSTMDRLRARALESLVLVQKMVGSITAVNDTTGAITWAEDGWAHQLKCLTNATYSAANTFNTSTWHLAADNTAGSTWAQKSVPTALVQGWGGTEAPRGALMHQITIENGKIKKYQCIVPTTWNGSPKVGTENGPIERACIGVPFSAAIGDLVDVLDVGNGRPVYDTAKSTVEVLRVAQSFDPCIACAVH